MKRNRWVSGDWLAICDSCGLDFYASQLRQRWDGMMVCEEDYETRHPQDFVRGIPDNMPPPWVRPDQPEETITNVTGATTLTWTSLAPLWSVYATGSNYNLTLPLASVIPSIGEFSPTFVLQTGADSVGITLFPQGPDFINNDQPSLQLNPNTKYFITTDHSANWTVQ